MKYLKEYKLFESVDVDRIKELFYDTMDDNFRVFIKDSNSRVIKFPDSGIISVHDLDRYFVPGGVESISDVNISKTEINNGHIQLTEFHIGDIIDNMIFAESYIKKEMGLEIKWVYITQIPKYTYYKSLDIVPKDLMLDKISIGFGKI